MNVKHVDESSGWDDERTYVDERPPDVAGPNLAQGSLHVPIAAASAPVRAPAAPMERNVAATQSRLLKIALVVVGAIAVVALIGVVVLAGALVDIRRSNRLAASAVEPEPPAPASVVPTAVVQPHAERTAVVQPPAERQVVVQPPAEREVVVQPPAEREVVAQPPAEHEAQVPAVAAETDVAVKAVTPPPTPPPAAGAAATDSCRVDVRSTPSQAEVALGDRVLGRTPLQASVPCGESNLVVRRVGFKPARQVVNAEATSIAEVSVDLARDFRPVRIVSSPPGARVTVAGRASGKTPTTVWLPARGRAHVKLALPGYQPWSRIVTVSPDQGPIKAMLLPRGGPAD